MKFASIIHDILRKTALTDLWIVSIFYVFIAIDGTKIAVGMQVGQYFTILLFSLIVTLSRYILKVDFIPFFVRVSAQFLTLLLSFFLVFGISGNISLSNSVPLIIAFVMIYALVMFVFVLVSKKTAGKDSAEKKNSKKKSDTYQSMF